MLVITDARLINLKIIYYNAPFRILHVFSYQFFKLFVNFLISSSFSSTSRITTSSQVNVIQKLFKIWSVCNEKETQE